MENDSFHVCANFTSTVPECLYDRAAREQAQWFNSKAIANVSIWLQSWLCIKALFVSRACRLCQVNVHLPICETIRTHWVLNLIQDTWFLGGRCLRPIGHPALIHMSDVQNFNFNLLTFNRSSIKHRICG